MPSTPLGVMAQQWADKDSVPMGFPVREIVNIY